MRVETLKDTQYILLRFGYMGKYNTRYYTGPNCPWEGSERYTTAFLSSVPSPSEHEDHFRGSAETLAQIIAERHTATLFHYFTL